MKFDDLKNINLKYLVLLLILSLSILVNIVLFHYPMRTKSDIPSIAEISILFWLFLFITSTLAVMISFRTSSKILALLMSVVYFFIFYSINLAFKVIPEQSDISSTSTYMDYLFHAEFFDRTIIPYFEYPVFFNLASIIHRFMDLNRYETINIGFFIIILSIPFALTIMVHKTIAHKNPRIYFIFPASFLILTFYFLNSQFIQQFVGFFFLICVTGAYIQIRETRNTKFYYLTIFFFIVCIYSHPFMFVFFVFGLAFMKLFQLLKEPVIGKSTLSTFYTDSSPLQYTQDIVLGFIKDYRVMLSRALEKGKKVIYPFIGKRDVRDISFFLIMTIYTIGFFNSFYRMDFFGDIISPMQERGETWVLIARIVGSKEAVGLTSVQSFPLYDILPQRFYLMSRYFSLSLLSSFVLILVINMVRTSIKKMNFVDIFVAIGSMIFLIAGFANSAFLGQRSLQATFLGTSKYVLVGRKSNDLISRIVILLIIMAPIVFTANMFVLSGISGNRFIEDNPTIASGEFLQEYGIKNTTIVSTDRTFYPFAPLVHDPDDDFQRSGAVGINDPNYPLSNIDVYVHSEKLDNRMRYYNVIIDFYLKNQSVVYSQGDSSIILNNNLNANY